MIRSLSVLNQGFPPDYFLQVKSVFLRKAAQLYGISEGADYAVTLKNTSDVPEDGYRITARPKGVTVEASTRPGLISGVGRVLQENDFDGDGMHATGFSGTYAPKQEFCGVYFASHFGNYYITAPEAELVRYVEDLALWGNRFMRVWFDFHHYTGIDDPAAQPILARLKLILKTAKYYGMKISMVALANEGYSTTPGEMKAEWAAQNGYRSEPMGHYHTEICPNKPGGLALILKNRLEMLDAFCETPPDILSFFVYDQGGCTCGKCAPWGANGYIHTIKALIPAVRQRFPHTKFGFCTWYLDLFTDGEWERVYKAFETDPFLQKEISYITEVHTLGMPKDRKCAEELKQGRGPGGKPLLGFPEISMQGCEPWGGFGASPLTGFIQRDWDNIGRVQAGMWCYSEGIYEDINKFTVLGLYQGRFQTAAEALRGYVTAELSKAFADDIVTLLQILDETLPRHCENREMHDPEALRIVIEHPEQVHFAAILAQNINEVLPERIKNGWRWRIIYLRALIDRALTDSDFYIRETCELYMHELEKLYFVSDETEWWVAPATRASMAKISCFNK